jgi:REP element-mobilizing transposase RayT
MRPRLYRYFGGIAAKERMQLRAAGGVDDHVHLLLTLPGAMSIAEAMKSIKAGSSRWIKQEFEQLHDFAWQEGYGAFSISARGEARVKRYIEEQEARRRRQPFEEELFELLDFYGVEYDPRYVLD